MSPVPFTWGPFLAKIFLKIDEIKIRPLTPPQNHFNTLPVLVADACIQEGWEKSGLFAFLGSARAAVGSFRKIGQFFDHLNFEKYEPGSLYVGPIFGQNFSQNRRN